MVVAENGPNGGFAFKCMRERESLDPSIFYREEEFRKNFENSSPRMRALSAEIGRNRILSMDAREKSRSPLSVSSKQKSVPIFVIMRSDSFGIDTSGALKIRKIKASTLSLKALKSAGVHGIAVEVWWGIVEHSSSFAYNWSLYEELFQLISELGLKLHVACCIVFPLKHAFISGVCGCVRYPAHPFGDGRWRFPGIGECQCYDEYMMEDLKMVAYQEGKPKRGNKGPYNTGCYNSFPSGVPFLKNVLK